MVIGRVAASATIGQDGKPHASLEVTAESVRFLVGKNGANGVPGATQGEMDSVLGAYAEEQRSPRQLIAAALGFLASLTSPPATGSYV